ncbi:hypothetical protein MAPG_03660 [Magnaporthiopsis poae ATCC 64411]|uniref:Uncharacterized protein n=1 Tax=Magnaporthiopsis poae (strain ATCC 64411 / 73-15) TaxID=644358 RepID=A0A0C4DUM0_MAGP6|nr:hypothetical protein MAPG_03660 [Magnaporthiopsis poae ATCC 64411]
MSSKILREILRKLLSKENARHVLDAINTVSNGVNTALAVYGSSSPEVRELKVVESILNDLLKQQEDGTDAVKTAISEHAEAIELLRQAHLAAASAVQTGTGDLTDALHQISDDLRGFTRASVVNQLVNAGSLLTNAAAVAHIKKLAEEAARIGDSLERISDNVYSVNARGEKFPQHVHSFVRSMIEKHRTAEAKPPSQPHFFVVFNQSTTWHAHFDNLNRQDPLGPAFLGYSHDLDELFAFIVDEARPKLGPLPIIHILVPSIGRVAITEPLTFPESAGPVHMTGQLDDDGLPFLYVCMPLARDKQNLNHIGLLNRKPRWVLEQEVGLCLPFFGNSLSTRLDPVIFDDPAYQTRTSTSLLLYNSAYFPAPAQPPRVLGVARAA